MMFIRHFPVAHPSDQASLFKIASCDFSLFVGSQFCTRASSPQLLADLQLPSASSYTALQYFKAGESPTEDFHLISSRPCWAYQGARSDANYAALRLHRTAWSLGPRKTKKHEKIFSITHTNFHFIM